MAIFSRKRPFKPNTSVMTLLPHRDASSVLGPQLMDCENRTLQRLVVGRTQFYKARVGVGRHELSKFSFRFRFVCLPA